MENIGVINLCKTSVHTVFWNRHSLLLNSIHLKKAREPFVEP